MPYIIRDLEQIIINNLATPEIIAILGPRQSGKTTLIRHIFETLENALFLSFEDRKTLELFVEDEKTFAELYNVRQRGREYHRTLPVDESYPLVYGT